VLVTRDTTERPEAIELGLAMLVGTDGRRLFDRMTRLLDDNGTYSRMSLVENPYGDGHASRRIADRLIAGAAAMRRRGRAESPEKGKKSGDAATPALLTPMKQ
jgi:UDP-N-acetylglucosamine 2-epimerase (non-hydrolysing)